jgi:hypothetical protein
MLGNIIKNETLRTRTIEFEVYLDKFEQDKMRVKLKTQQNKLIDVVYQYETVINGKWEAIVRYDCAHGFFHKDVLFPKGEKEKMEMDFDSLKSASQYAAQDIKDRWEWYKERYIKKLKK